MAWAYSTALCMPEAARSHARLIGCLDAVIPQTTGAAGLITVVANTHNWRICPLHAVLVKSAPNELRGCPFTHNAVSLLRNIVMKPAVLKHRYTAGNPGSRPAIGGITDNQTQPNRWARVNEQQPPAAAKTIGIESRPACNRAFNDGCWTLAASQHRMTPSPPMIAVNSAPTARVA